MVDWVLLGSGESNKGRNLAAFTCSLSADAPCLRQEKRVIIIIIIIIARNKQGMLILCVCAWGR